MVYVLTSTWADVPETIGVYKNKDDAIKAREDLVNSALAMHKDLKRTDLGDMVCLRNVWYDRLFLYKIDCVQLT